MMPQDIRSVSYSTQPAQEVALLSISTLDSALEITVTSASEYQSASYFLKTIKDRLNQSEATRTSIVKPINDVVKTVNALFRSPTDRLKEAEGTVKAAMLKYTTEQERIAAEARRKAEEEARKERERIEALEREKRAEVQRAAQEAEEAKKRGDYAAKHLAHQEATRLAQEFAKLELELEAQEVAVMPAVVPTFAPKGISVRTTYAADVVDLMRLVKAVAEGKAPIRCLQPDQKFLDAQARAFKKPGCLFDGVVIVEKRGLTARV